MPFPEEAKKMAEKIEPQVNKPLHFTSDVKNEKTSSCNGSAQKFRVVVIISILLWGLLWPRISSNVSNLSQSIMTGKVIHTIPDPLYGFLHFESKNSAFNNHTFAVDFAGVYFIVRNFDKNDIYSGNYDPRGPIVYSPGMLYFYKKTFCRMPFGVAAVAHLGFQVVLLLLSTIFILRYYKLSMMIVPVSLLYAVLITCSPVGLAWFERGQFDVYAAIALLFFVFGVYESKGYAFALAALFAAFKLTIAVIFIQGFIIYLWMGSHKVKWKFSSMFAGIFLFAFILFPKKLPGFFMCLQKVQNSPQGLTLVNKLPASVCGAIPVFCVLLFLLLVFFARDKESALRKFFLPYMTGLAGLNLLLLANNSEYRIMCCLGFIPLMFVWFFRLCKDRWYCCGTMACFFLFLLTVFHSLWFLGLDVVSWDDLILAYIAYYLAIVLVSFSRVIPMISSAKESCDCLNGKARSSGIR